MVGRLSLVSREVHGEAQTLHVKGAKCANCALEELLTLVKGAKWVQWSKEGHGSTSWKLDFQTEHQIDAASIYGSPSKSHSAQSRSGPVESGSWVHRLERVAGGPTQRLPGRYSGERRAEGWREGYRVKVPSHSSRWPTLGRPWSLARMMLRAIRMQRTFPARAAALSVQSRRPKPASLKAGQLFLHRRRRRVQRHGRVPWASCR